MRDRRITVSVIFAIFCTSYIESVPFIKKCKSDDSKCIRESSQSAMPIFAAGLPEYGIKKFDPKTYQSIDASTPGLTLKLSDVTIKGLGNCNAKKMKRDKQKGELFLKFQCSVNLDGKYVMKGKLLILPIEGDGAVHVTLRKAEITVIANLDDKGEYWNIKDWTHSFDLKEKSDVVFENLFNGNEVLAKASEELISQNGNEVVLAVGPSVIKVVVDDVIDAVNVLFHSIPAKDLSID